MTAEILSDTPDNLRRAAEALRTGGLVAFPTETVYGLGADATDDRAVARIFQAKNRPDFNPLIVHVPDADIAATLVDIPDAAQRIADQFWPGGLTLVLPRKPGSPVSRLATAGLDTIAIRVPAHDLARRLLRETGRPVAAPSANPSGRLSPTTAAHVAAGLGDAVDVIVDGGPCPLGLESTILGFFDGRPVLLRPGAVAAEEIEAVCGSLATPETETPTRPNAPGQLASHYAPRAALRLNAADVDEGEAFLGFGPPPAGMAATETLSAGGDLVEAAARLFAVLHELDTHGWARIAVAPIPETGLGRAINDRLRRAAAPRPD